MRLRRIKNIEEKIKKYDGLIIFDCENNKGMWKKSFGNDNPIYLEIGMGKGKFILKHALTNSEINYIGCEISDSVIYKAAEKAEGVSNLLMINKDASLLNDIFEEHEVSKIFLNFSDPWPKSRHAKRRLTSPSFLNIYKKLLGEGGIVEMKTDNRKLFEYSLTTFNQAGWIFEEISLDLHQDQENIITTEYEDKFVGLGQPIYFVKVRIK